MRPSCIAWALTAVTIIGGETFGQPTVRVAEALSGLHVNSISQADFSPDGRFVAFASRSRFLVPGLDGHSQIYLLDRQSGGVRLVSVDSQGNPATSAHSSNPRVSDDGRFVAFWSHATNLVPGDTNRKADVFVHDVLTGQTIRASVSSSGTEANGGSDQLSMSADGRWIVFASYATNLTSGGTSHKDVFLRDLQAGTTIRLSEGASGTGGDGSSETPDISADGRKVVFVTWASNLIPGGDSNPYSDIVVLDLDTGVFTLVSVSSSGIQADGSCWRPSISADGLTVAFDSDASNLVSFDTNGSRDVFVRDLLGLSTVRVSVSSSGAEANGWSEIPAISGDGRSVVFSSNAANLVSSDGNGDYDVFVHDLLSASTSRVSVRSDGAEAHGRSTWPAINGDGRLIAFESDAKNLDPADLNCEFDVYLHDRDLATTSLPVFDAEVPAGGTWSASLSEDARVVAFLSVADNLAPGDFGCGEDVFVKDLKQGDTRFVAPDGIDPVVSRDGRIVAFASWSSDLVPGDTNGFLDVFVHDLQAATFERISVSTDGVEGDGNSHTPSISADGRFVAFVSAASTMVPGDVNGWLDVFVRDRVAGTTNLISISTSGVQGDAGSKAPSISDDGSRIAFESRATNLVPSDTNGYEDIFVRDLVAGTTTLTSLAHSGDQADAQCTQAAISGDGRFVAFTSPATNLVTGDTNGPLSSDVFVRDLQAGSTVRVSVDSSGGQVFGRSERPRLSGDGRFVAFESTASDLVPDDTNLWKDIFVRDRQRGLTSRVSLTSAGAEAQSDCAAAALSPDGRYVAFQTSSPNFVPDRSLQLLEVFVRDRITLSLQGVPSHPNPVHFELEEAAGEAGNAALVVISCTGTGGFKLPGDGRTLLITPDACTDLGLSLSSFFTGIVGSDGTARTPVIPFPPIAPGIAIYAAAVTIDRSLFEFVSITGPLTFVSQ